MTKEIVRGSAADVALDLRATADRYGRSVQTVSKHWPKSCGFPKPDFFAGRTPFWLLSTLQSWEVSRSQSTYRNARAGSSGSGVAA